MSNKSKGRKKSNFIALTTVPSGSYFDFFKGGVNNRILDSDLYAALGVTGTIVQDGDPLGTPVLDTAGSVNNIRNIEAGSGILASVSAQNGVALAHNFTEDTTGVELVVDLTATQPKFRSLVAGSGINIAASNGEIQIATTAVPASTKTVIVNDVNDFPAAVAGVITLASETEYALTNDISTANRFVLGNNCVVRGADSVVINLTYTGTGNMFTSVNRTWTLKRLTITCSAGTFISFSGTGVEIFQLLDNEIVAGTLGTLSDFKGMHVDNLIYTITTGGFTFGGANGVFGSSAVLGTIDAGTFFDLASSTFDAFSYSDAFLTLNGTSIFLSGLTASGNINSGGLGSIHNSRFSGTGTIIQTIVGNDVRWQFYLNDDIEDTHKSGLLSLTTNATETVITVATTPVLVLGTWTVEHQTQFSGTTAGRLTYNGVKTQHFDLTMSFSAAPASGTNKSINFFAAKNGTYIPNSRAYNNVSSNDPARTTLIWHIELATGDYVEAYVANDTDTTNVLVSDAVIRVS